MNGWSITLEERIYLRDLAKKQREYSALPIMKRREMLWYKHNDLQGERPMIYFETWTFENDLLSLPICKSSAGKAIELNLKREMLNHELIDDDKVVSDSYHIDWNTDMLLFDLKIEEEHATDAHGGNLGFHIKSPITDLKKDMHLLKKTTYGVDREAVLIWKGFVEEVLGDILPVKFVGSSLGSSITQHLVRLMGMEKMLYSLIDYPNEFHEVMDRISDDYISYYKWMEKEKLLLLNNGNNWLGQGSFGFTHDLPSKNNIASQDLKLTDLWCFLESQETLGVSPKMFNEFFFPYYLKVANEFGLLSYGCCEPVHAYWEKSLSKLPRLRKISISPWCNEEYMGEVLKGSSTIYHRKPSPNFVGVGKDLDEVAFREHILKTLKATKGCKVEFSFRDIYNLEGNIGKPRRAVQIIREELENNW
ncbi:MAG: hypothetical protein WCI30_06270 [Clostridia bacterium]